MKKQKKWRNSMETITGNKITAGSIARTLILIIALVNQVLTSTGHAIFPFTDEQITQYVTAIFTIVTAIVAWWKNNSFTKAALEGDKVMKELKSENKSETEE